MTQSIKINDWTLTKIDETAEPMIPDLELAEKLGYERPRTIRDLIKRMEKAGHLSGVCRTVQQTSEKGGRPTEEYHLTEAQTLKVIARSKTELADKILDEVIAVYLAYRRGLLTSPPAPSMATELAALTSSVAQLASMMATFMSMQLRPAVEPAPADPMFSTYAKPAPSRAAPLQPELLAPVREDRWYGVTELQRRWGIDNEQFWQHFRWAGGHTRAHARRTQRGYQIREDIVDKILVQLNRK